MIRNINIKLKWQDLSFYLEKCISMRVYICVGFLHDVVHSIPYCLNDYKILVCYTVRQKTTKGSCSWCSKNHRQWYPAYGQDVWFWYSCWRSTTSNLCCVYWGMSWNFLLLDLIIIYYALLLHVFSSGTSFICKPSLFKMIPYLSCRHTVLIVVLV